MIAVVALLSAVGAVARYLTDTAITRRRPGPFPVGTLTINLAGAFVLGLVTGLAESGRLGPVSVQSLGPGFCAGFTTFSTWMWETVALWENGERRRAGWNIGLTVLAGVAVAAAGLLLGRC